MLCKIFFAPESRIRLKFLNTPHQKLSKNSPKSSYNIDWVYSNCNIDSPTTANNSLNTLLPPRKHKRASAEDMRAAAQQTGYGVNGTAASTTNDRAGIVNNAQPFSFTGAVGTDSNV
ncbi:uncharacterized protein LOC117895659 isoform X3 [Drosophila subobscura]|uniref:uncharacterized protein LOC117895659 isoform X3 n=1 Tax=Drosophila subobscura TaxID=7241 RepID=UPI00155A96DB|nr:uncharacterized protein LOC117895659 isoform X3 [Drosophila subobscura]